jgi:hypothetical protein
MTDSRDYPFDLPPNVILFDQHTAPLKSFRLERPVNQSA